LGAAPNWQRIVKPCLPKKNSSVYFSWDCRIASQFCMLLTRPPWLDIPWQETKKTFPELVEGNIHQKTSVNNRGS
jgi:hypothetical protein